MEKNIFEGAKFGDKFVTRDGRIAIILSVDYSDRCYVLSVEDDTTHYYHLYDSNGSVQIVWKFDEGSFLDIVSRYQEPIDEDKLDELVRNYTPLNEGDMDSFTHEQSTNITKWIDEAYKAGYRKAMEGKV